MWLWGISIICELWFAFSWLLDILPKLNPINRATDLEALKEKFETPSSSNPHRRSDLPGLDVFISTADPEKEPPLVTATTILSILTFEAMGEAVSFSEVWVLFCRKHSIEPRNPDSYFSIKGDPTKNKKKPDFVKDRRWIKREYDKFKVRINGLPEKIKKRCNDVNSREEKREKKLARERGESADLVEVTKAPWMADGTHWPGTWYESAPDHAKGDHAGILQVMTKHPDHDPVYGNPGDHPFLDFTGIDTRLPMFVYVSREK